VTYRKKTTLVEPQAEPTHDSLLQYVWESSKLHEEVDPDGQVVKWSKLGFSTENIIEEFQEVGLLGLECLFNFVQSDPEFFSKVVLEQLSRPKERRCAIATASNEIVELLSEHWAIFAPAYSTPTTFQPFFLNFYKVHTLAMHFFFCGCGAKVDLPVMILVGLLR